ncbi:MAG: rhomboid family intramembrane serine protease [Planctomyces sp.]|nr:rhomboid family intramembrane serine protease [Planctomyces sp.]
MLFFAPLNTDAPIYHWPRATLGLIIAQYAAFAAIRGGAFGPEDDVIDALMLHYGQGLRPLEWVTSLFVHGGWLHLLGNLFLLWGLGLVVEGKVGWWKFLAMWFAIGVIECALEQACLRNLTGGSFGSSSVLFGLLAIALLWAPRNEITFGFISVLPLMFRVGTVDLSIQWYALLLLLQETLIAWLNGFRPASEVLHLAGAAVGAGIGWMMLNRKWVDCEGWDLLSLLRHGPPPSELDERFKRSAPVVDAVPPKKPRARKADPEQTAQDRERKVVRRIRRHLAESETAAAWSAFQSLKHWKPEWKPPGDLQLELARALAGAGQSEAAVGQLRDYLKNHPIESEPVRIEAAELALHALQRPHATLRLLQPLEVQFLAARDQKRVQALRRRAIELIDAGALEFDSSG